MGARSGADYLESIRAAQPEVYLEGERVADITTHPAFEGPLRSVMEQYDVQLDPRYRDVCLYESPTTGEPVSTSFLQPRSREDLARIRRHCKLRSDLNFGLMGRSPDFMNTFVTGWNYRADLPPESGWHGARGAGFYEHARENDLFMTHVLLNPQIDRSKSSANQEDPFLHLGRVGETKDGIIVRGAKMLATMAPLTEEIVSQPFGGLAPGEDAYALVFSIPTNTPGLKFICREPYAVGRSSFDHPLSSRFEEMDCVAIFDDVLIPWERLVVDGSPGSANVVNSVPGRRHSVNIYVTSARLVSSMELMCGVAMRAADAVGIDGFLHVQEKLGEMLIHLENARAVFYGAEAMASGDEDGWWLPYPNGLGSIHQQAGQFHTRFIEIIQILGASSFFYTPTAADFASSELRPYLDKYVRGRPGVSAEERVRVFKLAWDLAGDAFGQRIQQYVRYYSGDPFRNRAGFYLGYDKPPLFDVVERALEGVDHAPVEVSPEDPRVRAPRRTQAEGLAGTYPLASLPK